MTRVFLITSWCFINYKGVIQSCPVLFLYKIPNKPCGLKWLQSFPHHISSFINSKGPIQSCFCFLIRYPTHADETICQILFKSDYQDTSQFLVLQRKTDRWYVATPWLLPFSEVLIGGARKGRLCVRVFIEVSGWVYMSVCIVGLAKKNTLNKRIQTISSIHGRNVTWKWELFRHCAILRNKGTAHFWKSASSVSSSTSSNSPKNIISFWLFVTGQYFRRPLITVPVSFGSFSINWVMQYVNCGKYTPTVFGLWSGINAFHRNNLCSSFNGFAKPVITLPNTSSSSAIPLWWSVSNTNL